MQKILIVDDDLGISKVLDATLKRVGFATAIANDGEEALQKLNSEKFDLIVLDIMLPCVDGMQILKTVRMEKNNPNNKTPVIMLTAKSEDRDILSGWQEGADAYLTKPFEPAEIVIMAKGILRDKEVFGT